jgi:hypothetical protein
MTMVRFSTVGLCPLASLLLLTFSVHGPAVRAQLLWELEEPASPAVWIHSKPDSLPTSISPSPPSPKGVATSLIWELDEQPHTMTHVAASPDGDATAQPTVLAARDSSLRWELEGEMPAIVAEQIVALEVDPSSEIREPSQPPLATLTRVNQHISGSEHSSQSEIPVSVNLVFGDSTLISGGGIGTDRVGLLRVTLGRSRPTWF